MTVTTETNSIQYDTSQISPAVPLAFPFQVYDPGDLTVVVNGITAVFNQHYTVQVASNNSSATVTPLAALLTLIGTYNGPVSITRDPRFVQPIAFTANQALPERIIEQGFDLAVQRDQSLLRRLANVGLPNAAALAFAQTYYGSLSADPAVRPIDGSPVQAGDRYFNTSLNRDRIFNNGAWQNGAISAQELASAGFYQPGDVFTSGRITAAPFAVFADGAAYSRTSFPKAFAGLTLAAAANVSSGVQTLQSVTKDTRRLGLEGAAIEIPSIGFTSTIVSVTATTILMATAPGASASGAAIIILPWGNGDGSTTFNVPNMAGRTPVGMNTLGTATGSLTAAWTARINGAGGSELVTLSVAQLPYVTQSVSVSVSASQAGHLHNFTGSNTSNQPTSGSGGLANAGNVARSTDVQQPPVYVAASASVSAFGNNQPHSVMSPGRALNYFVFMGDPTT